MNFFAILGIAVGLAMDAFSVCVAAGATIKKVDQGHFFRLSFHFGLFQFLMPIAGYLCGSAVAGLVSRWDHWIVLAVLAVIGGKMLWESFEKEKAGAEAKEAKDPSRGLTLIMLSVATSVDAAAVGFSFSALGVRVFLPAIVIGVVCAAFSAIGILLGRGIGKAVGKWAERLGGLVLIGIGVKILIEHLAA
jgi:manganese efflux pump family protein